MQRVAALTDRRGTSAFISPFFEMAPWILVCDDRGAPRFRWLRNIHHDRRLLRGAIVARDVDALLCGWIDRESLVHLMHSRVSVFMAPCGEPVSDLVAEVAARLPTPFAVFENLH